MACFSRTSFSSKLRAVWEGRRGEGRGGEERGEGRRGKGRRGEGKGGEEGDMEGEVEAITPSL